MMNWKDILQNCISKLPEKFEKNEMAFLALQGKIELQLRDKIAWELEKEGSYYIKKEYSPSESEGRQKVDLAILSKEDLKPVCLIEFKAHSSANKETEYGKRCENDCDKMKEMSKEANANPDKFFVFFQSSHEKEDLDNITRHSNLIAYVNYIKRGLNARGDIKTQWEDLFGDYGDLSENIKFEAGEYYGVKIHINTLILKVKP